MKQNTPMFIAVILFEAVFFALALADPTSWHAWLGALAGAGLGSTVLFASQQSGRVKGATTDHLPFLAHQVRTPLARMRDIASLLREEELGSLTLPQQEAIAQQQRAIEDMQRLAEDVLYASRAGTSGFSYDFQKVNLCDIMDALQARFEPFAQHKDIRSVWNKPEECPVEIIADAMKLQQALGNIVDNAIKYTPRGGRLTARIITDPERAHARVEIVDTGIGFSGGEKIFDAFVRGSQAHTAYEAGSGLGLFIASDIIRGHRGTIEAASEGVGRGASFFIELPIAGTEKL